MAKIFDGWQHCDASGAYPLDGFPEAEFMTVTVMYIYSTMRFLGIILRVFGLVVSVWIS
jgi:hypothetical protein